LFFADYLSGTGRSDSKSGRPVWLLGKDFLIGCLGRSLFFIAGKPEVASFGGREI
jgi:hypothetical protein